MFSSITSGVLRKQRPILRVYGWDNALLLISRSWSFSKGAANQEELSLIEQFLNRSRFIVLPVSESASRQAVQILKRYALSHGLGIPDALIAGIVLEADSALVTGNMPHFDFIDYLTAIRPPYRS